MRGTRPSLACAFALLAFGCASTGRHGHHVWNDFEIHPSGVHPATLGIPLARLEHILGPDFTVSSPITGGDLSGWQEVCTREGQLLYYVKPSQAGRIDKILVVDPRFATAEGIGAGATVEAAAKAYGSPVFTKISGRKETAMFPALTGRSLALLIVPPPGRTSAGDYRRREKTADGHPVTPLWLKGSSVRAVEISAL